MILPVWRLFFCLLGLLGVAASWAADDFNTLARTLLNSARDLPFPQHWTAYQVYASNTLDLVAFQRPYQNAINQLPAAIKRSDGPWLAPMQMQSALNRFLSAPQGEFIYISGCQPHGCNPSVSVVFDPATGKLALLLERAESSKTQQRQQHWLVGDYPPPMAALLRAVRAAEKVGHNRLPLPIQTRSKVVAALAQ